jgi:hypothetical protein
MRTTVAVLALAVTIAGCNSAEKEMLAKVRNELKDPGSAEFSHLELKKTTDGTISVLCGMVNAKNSFGGYVGPKPFTAAQSIREKDAVIYFGDEANCTKALQIAEGVGRGHDKR